MKTKAKIMIVDDAEMNREILMVILGDEYEYVQRKMGVRLFIFCSRI